MRIKSLLTISLVFLGILLASSAQAQDIKSIGLSESTTRYLTKKDFFEHLEDNKDERAIKILDRLLSDSQLPERDRGKLLFMKSMLIDVETDKGKTKAKQLAKEAAELSWSIKTNAINYSVYLDNTYVESNGIVTSSIKDAQPLVRMPGQVPLQALRDGRSGHCKLRFTVGKDGIPKDIKAYFCSHSMFEKNSIIATSKFRYRPKIVNGIPVEMPGVETKISYRVTDENGNILPE